MNFNEWCLKECNQTAKELLKEADQKQRYRLFEDYEAFCKENRFVPDFKD